MMESDPKLRTVQVIAGGIIAGSLIAAVIFVVVSLGRPLAREFDLFVAIGVLAGIAGVVGAQIVPAILLKQTSAQSPENVVIQSQIAKFAMLEGPVFLNLVLFLLQTNLILVAVALALIGWMAWQFPTASRLADTLAAAKRGT